MGGLCCGPSKDNQYKKTMLGYKDLKATYHIDRNVLGKGSFGTVYKGTNKQNKNHKLAIKAIDKKNLSDEEINDIHEEVKML